MAGIYVHIPFCKTKCHYCNFYSLASVKYKADFIKTLREEIFLQRNYLQKSPINTIYFGGGTPSLLTLAEITEILETVYEHFEISDALEITLEANPDDISEDWVKSIKESDVNRFSLGVQSFFDADLQYLNRVHNGREAENAIMLLQDHGFSNLSIDLIYGIPTLSDTAWGENLEMFFRLDIPHLSAYALTVEEKTALHNLIRKKKVLPLDESGLVRQFKALLDLTEKQKFIHYEISNFAREGFYSKHNSLYWTGGHYLGLGPSAHSYNGHSRRWNQASIKSWLDLKEHYSESFEEEILSPDQRYNEYVMTSLRTIWGCNSETIRQEFGIEYADHLLREAQQFLKERKLEMKGNRIFLTNKVKLFADGISSALFK
jgi:oxygen-independent coproporphyrinogen-3 oxidase